MLKTAKYSPVRRSGFLLIELLIALAVLVSLIAIVGNWQLRIHQQACELQYYNYALNLAENCLEQCLAGYLPATNQWQIVSNIPDRTVYHCELQRQVLSHTNNTGNYSWLQLTVSWAVGPDRKPSRHLQLATGIRSD